MHSCYWFWNRCWCRREARRFPQLSLFMQFQVTNRKPVRTRRLNDGNLFPPLAALWVLHLFDRYQYLKRDIWNLLRYSEHSFILRMVSLGRVVVNLIFHLVRTCTFSFSLLPKKNTKRILTRSHNFFYLYDATVRNKIGAELYKVLFFTWQCSVSHAWQND